MDIENTEQPKELVVPKNKPGIRALLQFREKQQDLRIGFESRVRAIRQHYDTDCSDVLGQKGLDLLEHFFQQSLFLEKQIDQQLADLVFNEPIVKMMCALRGIGPILSAKIYTYVDIERAVSVSSLWQVFGAAPGKDRPVEGEIIQYSKAMKALRFNIAECLIKANNPYYKPLYEKQKEIELARTDENKPKTKLHAHRRACRYMVKYFLAHLWLTWRELEGLPTRTIYILGHDGHSHQYNPNEFGWPESVPDTKPVKRRKKAISQ